MFRKTLITMLILLIGAGTALARSTLNGRPLGPTFGIGIGDSDVRIGERQPQPRKLVRFRVSRPVTFRVASQRRRSGPVVMGPGPGFDCPCICRAVSGGQYFSLRPTFRTRR